MCSMRNSLSHLGFPIRHLHPLICDICGAEKKKWFSLIPSVTTNRPNVFIFHYLQSLSASYFFIFYDLNCYCMMCYAKQAHKGRQYDDDEQDAAMTGKSRYFPFSIHKQIKTVEKEIFLFFPPYSFMRWLRGVEKFILRFIVQFVVR